MTCREFTEFLMDYLEGDLALAERTRFDEHLAACAACVGYLRSYAEAIRLGRTVCEEDHAATDDEVPEELVRAIVSARRRAP